MNRGLACLVMAALLTACVAMPKGGGSGASLPDLTSYVLMRTDAGARATEPASVQQAADVLAAYDVIFIGEAHQHPGNHLAEMALFRAIHERSSALSLSMEQFERDVQPVLDDYLAGKFSKAATGFHRLEKDHPARIAERMMYRRANKLARHPPEEEWAGVYAHTKK